MMTREEAIYTIERLAHTEAKWPGTEDTLEALDMDLSALRPVSRERVEKVFPGCALCNWGGLDFVGVDGDGIYLSKPAENEKFRFCPVCGKPLTDEAVDMTLKRMEEMMNEH